MTVPDSVVEVLARHRADLLGQPELLEAWDSHHDYGELNVGFEFEGSRSELVVYKQPDESLAIGWLLVLLNEDGSVRKYVTEQMLEYGNIETICGR